MFKLAVRISHLADAILSLADAIRSAVHVCNEVWVVIHPLIHSLVS